MIKAISNPIYQPKGRAQEYAPWALNHHSHAKTINWPAFREEAVALMEQLGVNYMIKKDLAEAK